MFHEIHGQICSAVIQAIKKKVKSQRYCTPRKIQNGKSLNKWQNKMIKHIKRMDNISV